MNDFILKRSGYCLYWIHTVCGSWTIIWRSHKAICKMKEVTTISVETSHLHSGLSYSNNENQFEVAFAKTYILRHTIWKINKSRALTLHRNTHWQALKNTILFDKGMNKEPEFLWLVLVRWTCAVLLVSLCEDSSCAANKRVCGVEIWSFAFACSDSAAWISKSFNVISTLNGPSLHTPTRWSAS